MCTRQHGLTLVELVIAIVVAGIMVAGLMSAYSSIVGHSADPMVREQAVATAESMLEEALLKPYLDPVTHTRCPAPPGGTRSNFDNVCDYNGYTSNGMTLPDGTAVTGLENYNVSVTVQAGALGAISANCALKVTVYVTSPLNETTSLSGYRTDYESSPPCT